ncbi:MAG: permease-like cell division protein FtsX [Bacteroidales bacterium]|jgi:cell division transport system permease protein|nr:permease-like cell division protein FtsX [Bacteroidales bacterium]
MTEKDKTTTHRLATTTVSTVISITLVLYVIGFLGIVLINARQISTNVRENFGFEVMLASDISEGEISEIKNILSAQPYVKSLRFVSQQEATAETVALLGHDFTEIVGNIIPSSFQLKIYSKYTHLDSLQEIEKQLHLMDKVTDVNYQRNYISQINENLYKISIILLGICALFLIISIALISNTIRLSIYAKRFIIRSMLLVGAKQRTIYAPFIARSIIQGILGACFACILLGLTLYGVYMQPLFAELVDFSIPFWYIMLLGGIFGLGFLISWLSASFAVRKYIKIKIDKLYS